MVASIVGSQMLQMGNQPMASTSTVTSTVRSTGLSSGGSESSIWPVRRTKSVADIRADLRTPGQNQVRVPASLPAVVGTNQLRVVPTSSMAPLPADPPAKVSTAPSGSSSSKHFQSVRSWAGFSSATTSVESKAGMETPGDLGFTQSAESFFGVTANALGGDVWESRRASTPPMLGPTPLRATTSERAKRVARQRSQIRLPPSALERRASQELAITGENARTRQDNSGGMPELPPGFCMSKPSQQAALFTDSFQEIEAQASAGATPFRPSQRSPTPPEGPKDGTRRSSHSFSPSPAPDPMLAVVSLAEWLRMHGLEPSGPIKPNTADPDRKGRRRSSRMQGLGLRMNNPSMSDGFFGFMKDDERRGSTSRRKSLQDKIFSHLQQLAEGPDFGVGTGGNAEDLHIIKMTLHDRNARRRLGDILGPNLLAQLARKAGMEDFRGRRGGGSGEEDPQAGGRRRSSAGQIRAGSKLGDGAGKRPTFSDSKDGLGGYGTGPSPKSGAGASSSSGEDEEAQRRRSGEMSEEAAQRKRREEEEERRQREAAEAAKAAAEAAEEARRQAEAERERLRRLSEQQLLGGSHGEGDEDEERHGSKDGSHEVVDPFMLFTVKPKPDDSDSADDEGEDGAEGGKRKRKKRGMFASQDDAGADGDGQDGQKDDYSSMVVPFSSNSGWMKLREDLAAEFRVAIREAWGRIDGAPVNRRDSDSLHSEDLSEVGLTEEESEQEETPQKTWEEEVEEVEEEVLQEMMSQPRSPLGSARPSFSRTPMGSRRASAARSQPGSPSRRCSGNRMDPSSCSPLRSPLMTPSGSRPDSRGKRTSLLSPEMIKTIHTGVQLFEDDEELAFERMLTTGSMVSIGDTTSRLQRKRYGTRLQARTNAALARKGSRHRWSEHIESCKRSLTSLESLTPFRGRTRKSVGLSTTESVSEVLVG